MTTDSLNRIILLFWGPYLVRSEDKFKNWFLSRRGDATGFNMAVKEETEGDVATS